MSFLLDTNIVSEIRQKVPNAGVSRWFASVPASELLIDFYGDRIIPVTVEVAEAWGRLNVPDPLPVVDGLLAATALMNGWTLVTRNASDVASTGVRLLNPFIAEGRLGE